MGNFTQRLVPFLVPVLLAGAVPAAHAAEAEDMIKFRQSLMKGQAGYMGMMARIVDGKVPFEPRMLDFAYGLAGLTTAVVDAFPKGSDFGETETKALDKIWQDFDDFKAKAQESQDAAEALIKAVESGDRAGWGKAFADVGETCKGCHKVYRKKDE